MSRFVLIECEDDDQANNFVNQINKARENGKLIRIAGLYARPNTWCGCPFQIAGEKRQVDRGTKFGWWICQWCNKPRPGTQQLANLISTPPESMSTRYYQYGVDTLSVFEVPNPRRKKND